MYCAGQVNVEGQLEEWTLHHLAKNLQLSVLYSSITGKNTRFLQELQKRNDNLRAKFSDFSAPEKTLWAKVQKAIQPQFGRFITGT